MIECLAVSSVLWQPIETQSECGRVSLDLAGRVWKHVPSTSIPTDFALHRAGIGLGVYQGDLHGRVQVGHIQTGASNSYIGVGGESNLYRIQLASIQYRPINGVQLSAGIVEDFWVESGNHTWGLRNVEATAAESLGWMDRGNMGMSAVWSGEELVVATSLHTGEGAYRRERNAGKNTAVYVRWSPLDRGQVSMELYAQDGSYGFGSQRNHRLGGRISTTSENGTWRAGLSGLQSWGVRGDGARAPLLIEGWGSVDPIEWLRVLSRVEHIFQTNSQATSVLLGVAHPISSAGNLGVYWKTWSNSEQWTAVSGSDVAQSSHHFILQLDGRFVQSSQ